MELLTITCPEHDEVLIKSTSLKFAKDKNAKGEPAFYCVKCNRYYTHLDNKDVGINRMIGRYNGVTVYNTSNMIVRKNVPKDLPKIGLLLSTEYREFIRDNYINGHEILEHVFYVKLPVSKDHIYVYQKSAEKSIEEKQTTFIKSLLSIHFSKGKHYTISGYYDSENRDIYFLLDSIDGLMRECTRNNGIKKIVLSGSAYPENTNAKNTSEKIDIQPDLNEQEFFSKVMDKANFSHKNIFFTETKLNKCISDNEELEEFPYFAVVYNLNNKKYHIPASFCKECHGIYIKKKVLLHVFGHVKSAENVKRVDVDSDLRNIFDSKTISKENESISNKKEVEEDLEYGNSNSETEAVEVTVETHQEEEDSEELPIMLTPAELYTLRNREHCECGTSYESQNVRLITIGKEIEISTDWCKLCNKHYIDISRYNELLRRFPVDFILNNKDLEMERERAAVLEDIWDKKTDKKSDAHKKSEINEEIKIEPLDFKLPKNSEEDIQPKYNFTNIINYEAIEQEYNEMFTFSLLHYAIIYRRWDKVTEILNNSKESDIEKLLFMKAKSPYEWITPLVCIKWNLLYFYAYDEKNRTGLAEKIEPYLEVVEDYLPILEYDSIVDEKRNLSVFDIFFKNIQPMLDVIYRPNQVLASKQVNNHGVSLVMDEVGTGKTVTALYSMRDVLEKAMTKKNKAKILIVCPHAKREDWQNDIRRQLGRYAHIVNQGDPGEIYEGGLKKAYFKGREHYIFIAGQKQSETAKNGSSSALKETVEKWSKTTKWDLIIIDEAHLSFNNFSDIRADRAMLLTATPIVVNSLGTRSYFEYQHLLSTITGKVCSNYDIDPLYSPVPSPDNIYVNWFREDMGKEAAERRIKFVNCKRHPEKERIFNHIKWEKGTLAALQYEQDDEYLFEKAKNDYLMDDIPEIKVNYKLNALIDVLKKNNKSYIIFCEHKEVVDRIFEKISNIFIDAVVGSKKGKIEECAGVEGVGNGQLIDTLMYNLRQNKRVLFVTTGKTGGTGLNLGEFDGVIHYELPFTSIELEQRFGRVDRIDTQNDSGAKDMIFLVNEVPEGGNDLTENRMLYYCTTKIDITCRYMPIRNTVLYYPDFIRRNSRAIAESLENFRQNPVLSIKNETKIKDILRDLRRMETEIKKSCDWNELILEGESFNKACDRILSSEQHESITEKVYVMMGEYCSLRDRTKSDVLEYRREYDHFKDAEKQVKQWLGIVGLIQLDDETVFTGRTEREDSMEKDVDDDDVIKNDYVIAELQDLISEMNRQTVNERISKIIDLLTEIDIDELLARGFSSEGIFCYIDGEIYRKSVEDYRSGTSWK